MMKAMMNAPNFASSVFVERVLLIASDRNLRYSRQLLTSSLGLAVDLATGPSEIFRMSREIRYNLVVLDRRGKEKQASQVAECVRTRWPKAKILLLGESSGDLDDWLYDDLVDPRGNPAVLVQFAQRMLVWARTGRIPEPAKTLR
jgi:hypothetical protein